MLQKIPESIVAIDEKVKTNASELYLNVIATII